MTLLRQIQEDAVSADMPLAHVLRRCRVLAARLESGPLEEWIRYESEGYPRKAELPEYRILKMRVLGHFVGSFGTSVRNAEIPVSNIPEQIRKYCTEYQCRESVAAIESLLQKASEGLKFPIREEAVRFFGGQVYVDMECMSAWGEITPTSLEEITNLVRNKVLDFALRIEKADSQAGDGGTGTPQLDPKTVTNIFNTTIHGGSIGAVGNVKATNVIGSNVTKGDTASLRAALEAGGVDASDVDDLEEALAHEPSPSSDGSFGPKVAKWIGKMTGKAASGAWNVAVGAGGSLLAKAIASFYGVSP